ncbi:MAG: serine hydrolase [Balneolaceae bacterium]
MHHLAGIRYYLVLLAFTCCFTLFFNLDKPGSADFNLEPFNPESVPTIEEEEARQFEKLVSNFREIGTVNSIVIRKQDGELIEKYFDWMNADRATNIKSASKSILSLLIGIAIDKSYLAGVDQTLEPFFPEYFKANPDSEKAAITIKDLLTMRSGLRTTSFHHYGKWVSSDDWVTYALDRPLVQKSGDKMVYSTGSSHLLSVILTKATGMNTKEFAEKHLFKPMDIELNNWIRDPQGYYLGGNDMVLKPEDMIKIGRMVMDFGNYNGKQLVSKEWIEESLKAYTKSPASHYDYGYMWWREKVADYEIEFAWGYAGQYILMFPELDAVVAITSDITRNRGSREYQKEMFAFIENSLIPYLEY